MRPLLLLLVALAGCSTREAKAACAGSECLPDVKYIDTSGNAYTPESLRGKVVIINFWATWCGPCKKEIPDLSKVYAQYKSKGVVMLGILANDNPSPTDLLNFQSDYEMEYPVVRQSSDILVSYDYPQALPTTFIFDRSGKRFGAPHVGALQHAELEQIMAQLTK